MALNRGARLGPYEIREPLGAGGMGEVWRARDTRLDRDVAIKVLPDRVAGDADAYARFQREAKAVAALSHPNIMAIYDFGRQGQTAYAVVELLDGETLRAQIEAGPLPPRKVAELGRQIARGLAAAHDRGIVHRDVKPENLFITREGRAKVLDFGLAAQRRPGAKDGEATETPTQTLMTAPGTVLGTVSYMSPEQVRGEPATTHSDVFSFGCVLYEMLSGRRPFVRETPAEIMTGILREDPPDLPEAAGVPAALERILRRCLEKRPEERFRSAHDLAFALETVFGTSTSGQQVPQAVREAGTGSAPGGAASRWRWGALSVALGVGALAGAAATVFLRPPPLVEPIKVSALTFSGTDGQPSAAPDGRTLAFTSARDGRSRIWLKQFPEGGEAALTEGPDIRPRFSPDGTQVLFTRIDAGAPSIYRAPVVGGGARKLLAGVAEADWSPDGTQIAFVRMEQEGAQLSSSFGVASADGGNLREIARLNNRRLFGIRWAPDGRRLAATECSITNNTTCTVTLADVETGGLRRLSPVRPSLSGAAWVDASTLVYAWSQDLLAGIASTATQVVLHQADSDAVRPLFWEENLIVIGTVYATLEPLVSGHLVFDALSYREGLGEYSMDGTASVRVLTRGDSRDRQPVYAPDGETILFSSNRAGNLDLWTVTVATGEVRRLTEDAANDWDPGYTPDGTHVLWSSGRSGNLEIWIAAADGSGARQVTRDGVDAENPTATPDGRWVVYSSGNPAHTGIWRIRPDGSEASMLVPGAYFLPDTSPAAPYTAFVRTHPDTAFNEILVLDVESGELVDFRIQVRRAAPGASERTGAANLGRPRWLRDGSAIAFLGEDDEGRRGIYVQDFVPGRDTSATRRKLAGFASDREAETFAFSPDGRRLTLAEIQESSSLMLAENVPGVGATRD